MSVVNPTRITVLTMVGVVRRHSYTGQDSA